MLQIICTFEAKLVASRQEWSGWGSVDEKDVICLMYSQPTTDFD